MHSPLWVPPIPVPPPQHPPEHLSDFYFKKKFSYNKIHPPTIAQYRGAEWVPPPNLPLRATPESQPRDLAPGVGGGTRVCSRGWDPRGGSTHFSWPRGEEASAGGLMGGAQKHTASTASHFLSPSPRRADERKAFLKNCNSSTVCVLCSAALRPPHSIAWPHRAPSHVFGWGKPAAPACSGSQAELGAALRPNAATVSP